MRRIIASVAMVALLIGTAAPAAHAGGSTDAALGLASFAVFNQLFGGAFHHRPAVVQREVVYNAETKFTIQNKPDGSVDDVIVGRRVICLGKLNDKAQLLATRVEVRSR